MGMGMIRATQEEKDFFARLKKGDEIQIEAGFGWPRTTAPIKEIILDICLNSALTNQGRRLMCEDVKGIALTGNSLQEFDSTQEALQIMEEARSR